ncbi:MAG: decaprenyl-phosphate phosphoribosyltransferase, partial [Syntrophothermus sp.]
MKSYIQLLRPKQYIKNLFIFAPLLFSFSFNDPQKVIVTLYTFIIFSLTASSIYIVNDILDLEEDRNHPKKKTRPIASGKISVNTGLAVSGTLVVISLVASYIINMGLLLVIGIYLVNNLLYSMRLKHVSVLDILMIALGFLLRVIAGGIVGGIYISMWIILMTFLLSVFLGFAKRRDDVLLSEKGLTTRKNIDGYNLEFINAVMVLMAAVTIVAYISYTVSPEVIAKFGTHNLYLTSFFVIAGILRYMQITFVNENSGNPTDLVFKDRF